MPRDKECFRSRGTLAAALMLVPGLALAAPPNILVTTTSFRGENCAQCHAAIRDRTPGPIDPQTEPIAAGFYDAVVVGGGMAGLTAAYYLRDYKTLVLDKESKAGGKLRRESFDGHPYAVAGVYMGKPEGKVQDLFKSLRLKLERMTFTDHTLRKDGRTIPDWIAGDPTRLPYSPAAQARIKKMQAMLRALSESDKLAIPVENSDPATLERYEEYSFFQWIDNNYGPEASELADLYARDVFGVSSKEISAAAGLLFLSSEFTPSYTWEGGLGVASEALAKALGPSLSTGAYVWKVSQDLEGATVDFYQDGRDYRARARAVVLAVPSLVVRRIAVGLTDAKRQALAKVRYSSYFLAPLSLKKVLWKDSFVYWAPGHIFTDLTLPLPGNESLKAGGGEILEAYAPMGEDEGRRTLLASTDEELTAKVLADLDTVFPGASGEVAKARVIRWGHAMPIPYPGYLTKVRPMLARPDGRLFFAGVDTEMPSIEGAVYSGVYAAAAARRFLKTQPEGAPAAPAVP